MKVWDKKQIFTSNSHLQNAWSKLLSNLMAVTNYTLSPKEKQVLRNFCINFAKSQLIFKILSQLNEEMNLRQNELKKD